MTEFSRYLVADKLLSQRLSDSRTFHTMLWHTEGVVHPCRRTVADEVTAHSSTGSFESKCYIYLMHEGNKPTGTGEVGRLEKAARPLLAG